MKRILKLRWLAALSVIGSSTLLVTHANGGESIDRLGRLLGFGWSDGYHACSQDGFQLGENLPPRSYSADHALYATGAPHAAHTYQTHGSAPCANCNDHGHSTNSSGLGSLNGPIYGSIEDSYSQPHGAGSPEVSPLMTNPSVAPPDREPAPRDDTPYDALDLENPASPSDHLRATESTAPARPQASPRKAAPDLPAPSKPTPPRPAASGSAVPKPAVPKAVIPTPMPVESDDDLLLDMSEDTDGLIDELPPPARDPLSPENSTRYLRPSRRSVAPVAQTSASVPVSKPTRIGTRDPQRLPLVR